MIEKIAVGTTNPVKINAVKQAFMNTWPEIQVEVTGIDVPSGVGNQPMSPEEAITGARNRAKKALEAASDSMYGVGIEGALEQVGAMWFDCGWCVVVDRDGNEGISTSARIPTPESIMKHIRDGMELGDALDVIYNRENVKQEEGHVGIMTNKHVSRTDIYADAVTIALGRFLHPELFQ